MRVITNPKALLLKVKNPERIQEVIPRAKTLTQQGKNFLVMPHTVRNVQILTELGMKPPSPILCHYEWAGKFKPFKHQEMTADFLTRHRKALVLNEIGTGKSNAALWAADYLMRVGEVSRCLIISPLSTLQRVWADAIFTSLYDRDFAVLHGSAARRKKLLNQGTDFCIVNHEGFGIIAEEAKDQFDLVIVDEAAVLRNPSTQKFKIFRKWVEQHPDIYLWLMTGTPTPNEPTDAWALAKLVDSPNLVKTYTGFRQLVMHKVAQWTWVPRPESVEIVNHVLQPAVRYKREDCFDLPDTVVQTRQVGMTPEQQKHYKDMLKHLTIELQGEDVTAVNEAVKMQKLIQIACGVTYDDTGRHLELDCKPRVKLVEEIVQEAGSKVIVFVPLTGTLHMLERELSKRWSVGVVNGEVSNNKRNVIFNDFQNARDPKILIAHPGTMSHGLTLTSASTIIWYGPITSNEQYVQANGRIERYGKKTTSNVVHIVSTDLEEKIYSRLANKQKLQGLLLDLIQQG